MGFLAFSCADRRTPPDCAPDAEPRSQCAPASFRVESEVLGFRADLRADGVEVASSMGASPFRPRAARWGCDGEVVPVARGPLEVRKNRATYLRGVFDEWYVNVPRGLEQGFTIPAPPACRKPARATTVVIELEGGLDAAVSPDGKTATLRDVVGHPVLYYGDVHVIDGARRELPSELRADAGKLALRFDDAAATYPVTVDPVMWAKEAALRPTSGVSGKFPASVALSADTLIAGAMQYPPGVAAGYVFVRSGSTWSQQAALTASDGVTGDAYGNSVALSGDTAIVTAAASGTMRQGAAYVFVRSGSSWSQQEKLTAADGFNFDSFGTSGSISGDTVIIGAPGKTQNLGAAYVFVRSGSAWSQQQELTPSDATVTSFGGSVAIDGDTAIVNAVVQSGGASVYVRSGTSWSQQQVLTPSDPPPVFFDMVALSGDTAVVGASGTPTAPGAAYVFTRSGATWSQQQKLAASNPMAGDGFGTSVAVNGDVAVVGAPLSFMNMGDAYAFSRSGSSWSQPEEINLPGTSTAPSFGSSVAVSGMTIVVANTEFANVFVPQSASCPVATCPPSDGGGGGTSSGSPMPTTAAGCRCSVAGETSTSLLPWLGALAVLARFRARCARPRPRTQRIQRAAPHSAGDSASCTT
jgi:hypothetical protein